MRAFLRPVPLFTSLLAAAVLLAGPAAAQSRVAPSPLGGGERPMPAEVQEIAQNGVTQRIGGTLPLDTPLRDQHGNAVRLGDYFGDDKPVIIEFAYLDCPLLCPMVENGVIRGIKGSGRTPGKDFTVLTISISPRDTPDEARERLASIVERLGGGDSELGAGAAEGWHLLTGHPRDVRALANVAGFGYAQLPEDMSGQLDFAHAAVILFASPSGTITRYLPGIKYPDKDFRLALVQASEGRLGSLFDMVLQLCFHFDDSTGKYTANALTLMKFAGAVTVVTLAAVIGGMFFFERKRRLRLDADEVPGSGTAG